MRFDLRSPLSPGPRRGVASAAENVLMLRAMGFLFIAGGVLGAVWLLLPHPQEAHDAAIAALVGLAVLIGLGLVATAGRIGRRGATVLDVVGMTMIGLAVHLSEDAHTAFSMMFVWTAAYNAYFYRGVEAVALLAYLAAIFAVALGTQADAGTGWVSFWLVTVVALSVTTGLIAWLVRERERAEREREHLGALVAESDEAIYGVSLDGLLTTWNRGAEALYGYAAEEVIGTPLARLVPDEYDDLDQLLDRLGRGERVIDHETVRMRKDASPVAVSLTMSPIHDSAGRVIGGSIVARDISRHKELEMQREEMLAQSRREALTDALTGLDNRRSWDRELRRALARATRERRPVCVGLIDLDHFKEYNDRHGHLAGDQLLREAAATWRAQLREEDLIARYGGEEFAVLLPNCTAENGREIIERLRTSTPLGESSSAGITDWRPGDSVEALTARADAALYRAKRDGRNRLVTIDGTDSKAVAGG